MKTPAGTQGEYHSYNLTGRRFLQRLSLTYVYIYCLDHPFYTLLAAGYFGFGTVSCFLAAYSAVQITRYRTGWGFWFTKKRYHAARQITTAVVSGVMSIVNFQERIAGIHSLTVKIHVQS